LEPRDGNISAPVFTLARLHPIPENLRNSPNLFNSLKANKDPRDPNDPGYIDAMTSLEAKQQRDNEEAAQQKSAASAENQFGHDRGKTAQTWCI
jgi:hypothetical protein